jgi:hypothetical protein
MGGWGGGALWVSEPLQAAKMASAAADAVIAMIRDEILTIGAPPSPSRMASASPAPLAKSADGRRKPRPARK